MTLLVVILSATCQLESSKPGCASGDSSVCFQFVSAGSVIGGGDRDRAGQAAGRRSAGVRTGRPFQVTWLAAREHLDVRVVAVVAGERERRPPALLVAVRSRCVPRTSTGPGGGVLPPERLRRRLVGEQQQQRPLRRRR